MKYETCLLHILQVISLSSDEVMLIASTFLESSTRLLVTLLESLSLHQQYTAGGTLKTDAQRRAAYSLIDVVQPKFVVPWGWFRTSEGVLIPPPRIIDQWCGFIDLRGLDIFGLAHTIGLQNDHSHLRKQYKAVNIALHWAMFSKLQPIKVNRF